MLIMSSQFSSSSLPARNPHRDANPDRSFYVSGMKVLDAVLPYADRVYFEWGTHLTEAREACEAAGREFVTILPRFDAGDECGAEGSVMIANPSQFASAKGSRIYTAASMNAFNSLFPGDVYQATLSVELSRNEVSDLVARYPARTEVMAFGRTELMYTRDPGIEAGAITDEMGASFPVYRDSRGFARILNSVDLFLLDDISELGRSGVSSVGIDVRKRPPALAKAVARYSRDQDPKLREKILEMCGGTFTQGLYKRGLRQE